MVGHIDQLEILRRARTVPREETEKALCWLEEKFGSVEYDGKKLTRDSLGEQVNCYRARRFVAENQTREETEKLFLETMGQILPFAEQHGVSILIEPINRYESNFINSVDEAVSLLWRLRDLGSPLQGHPCMWKLPGVGMPTGSLGMGLSVGVGMGLALLEAVCVKPLDEAAVVSLGVKTGRLVTLEEHTVCGGLGDAVCSAVCREHPVPVLKIGMDDCFGQSARNYASLLEAYGLDGANIARRVEQFVQSGRRG